MEKEKIDYTKFEMRGTNFFTRRSCAICGGLTSKDSVVCRAYVDYEIYACQRCVEKGDIDAELKKHIDELKNWTSFLESLIGRVHLPSLDEWQEAEKKEEEYWAEQQSCFDIPKYQEPSVPLNSDIPF